MSAASRPAVLIFGLGEVGRYLLEFAVRDQLDAELVAADLDLEQTQARVDNAIFGAALHHRDPTVTARAVDLLDVDRTSALLDQVRPTVVVNCSVLQTWHVIRRLPTEIYERLSSATLGAWLPVQLALPMKLGEAIRRAGLGAHYVNTSLSDLTNPVLRTIGLSPTIGIGNVALIETAVTNGVARQLELPRSEVKVTLVAHHVHWVLWREAGYREGAPFWMKIEARGQDVTGRFDTLALMRESILRYPSGTSFSAVSASSALHNVKALLSEQTVHTHSPAPNGLPGGYPVTLSTRGAEVDLPRELALDRAIAMNLEAQTFDGIERVDDDGRVHFMPYSIEIMKDLLGLEVSSFTPDDCVELAREQMARFRELERRYLG